MVVEFRLPDAIAELVAARNRLRQHFGQSRLKFTLDGNFVGDLAEAIAVERYAIILEPQSAARGIDGHTRDGKTVQVKSSGTGGGPRFRPLEQAADYLLFFAFDYDRLTAKVLYNGPEAPVRQTIKQPFNSQREVRLRCLLDLDKQVLDRDRLLPIS